MATTFSFDETNRIITVGGATEVTIQELVNAIRNWEDDLDNMDIAKIADTSGKETLAPGVQVGITLKLLNWKVKFEDQPSDHVVCTVRGGNIVAVDGVGDAMSPIEPAANVTVVVAQSTSAGLVAEWSQAQISNQLAASGAIQAKTDLLPSDPAAQSLVQDIKDIIGTPTLPTIAEDLDAIEQEVVSTKGVGWTDETLKKLAELVANIRVAKGFQV